MTRPGSRLLVIDASVVQSAGETEHPVSRACREFLNQVLKVCHRVAVTEAIAAEWRTHMKSRFSRKWRVAMAARQKPIETVDPVLLEIDTSGLSAPEARAIAKDICLLEAAMAADRIIVTRDDALRAALAKTRHGSVLLRQITWVNPVFDGLDSLR